MSEDCWRSSEVGGPGAPSGTWRRISLRRAAQRELDEAPPRHAGVGAGGVGDESFLRPRVADGGAGVGGDGLDPAAGGGVGKVEHGLAVERQGLLGVLYQLGLLVHVEAGLVD